MRILGKVGATKQSAFCCGHFGSRLLEHSCCQNGDMTSERKRTALVQGGLASVLAAPDGEDGLQIMTQRNWFSEWRPAGFIGREIEICCCRRLGADGLKEIENVRHLPGTPGAVAGTLGAHETPDIRPIRARDAGKMLTAGRATQVADAGRRRPARSCRIA